MCEHRPAERPQPKAQDPDATIYGRLALACGALAFAGSQASLDAASLALSARTRGLPPPDGVTGWLGFLALVGFFAWVAGWYFLLCGYVAHDPEGRWTVGCLALGLLTAATLFSCIQV